MGEHLAIESTVLLLFVNVQIPGGSGPGELSGAPQTLLGSSVYPATYRLSGGPVLSP